MQDVTSCTRVTNCAPAACSRGAHASTLSPGQIVDPR
jgi:hypothetical protein